MDSSMGTHGLYGVQWLSTPEVASLCPWYAFCIGSPTHITYTIYLVLMEASPN